MSTPPSTRLNEKQQALAAFFALLQEQSVEVFHSPESEPFIRVPISGHKENFPLKKGGLFEDWVQHLFFVGTGWALPKGIFGSILDRLQAQARFAGPELQTPLRIGEHDGKIYLDLCNKEWTCVEITTKGWQIIGDPPIRFRRSPGMLSLPTPEPDGDIQDIFRFTNIKSPSDQILALAWLLATFRPTGPYPILALHGSQGSAKTTTETVLRRLIDPSRANLSGVPRDERDVLIQVKHSHLLGFDNFSSVRDSLSDALCRIATGSGLATRKLYTDDTQTIFSGCRPILLNGITDLATRGDLLDRMILLNLPKIQEADRREERTLLREFEAAQPKILGALLNATSAALRKVKQTKLTKLPRMADFAAWAVAGAEALGFSGSEFLTAYERNRIEANFIALENSPAAVEIFKWASERASKWQGTCQQLLAELNPQANDGLRRDPNWPKSARGLSAVLARSEPNLTAAGIAITKLPREAGTGQRRYEISIATSSRIQIALDNGLSTVCDDVTVERQKAVA